eukprot:TRINITY_DN9910_c0_g3_i1.p4 TRINITY_DN9910_c0_g3~~TRINITY_DN9910_c0_g3_i1.p4  ORF type:complete len:109 (+),score=17.85 TRINITY_DN9910_c0_g3_i1:591-917(+)
MFTIMYTSLTRPAMQVYCQRSQSLQTKLSHSLLTELLSQIHTTGFYETNKAGNAVAALKASLKPQAHCKRDGKWVTLESSLLVPGDLVLLGSGAAVPADCIVSAIMNS